MGDERLPRPPLPWNAPHHDRAGPPDDGRVRDRRKAGVGALPSAGRRGRPAIVMRIGFGVNFMPSAPVLEVVEWARAVERHGYDLLGISDSQSVSRDVYVTLAHCATATRRIRFGSRVITPVTRHPAVAASAAATLEELAPGRTLIRIGSGGRGADTLGAAAAPPAEVRA